MIFLGMSVLDDTATLCMHRNEENGNYQRVKKWNEED